MNWWALLQVRCCPSAISHAVHAAIPTTRSSLVESSVVARWESTSQATARWGRTLPLSVQVQALCWALMPTWTYKYPLVLAPGRLLCIASCVMVSGALKLAG